MPRDSTISRTAVGLICVVFLPDPVVRTMTHVSFLYRFLVSFMRQSLVVVSHDKMFLRYNEEQYLRSLYLFKKQINERVLIALN